MPGPESMMSLKGTVDVYVVRGQIRARAWPRKPRQPNSVAQQAHHDVFRKAMAWIKSNPQQHKVAWREMTDPLELGVTALQRSMAIKSAQENIFTRPIVVLDQILQYNVSGEETALNILIDEYPGFENKEVEFFFKPYLGEFDHLETRLLADARMIDGKPKAQIVPVLTEYFPPKKVTFFNASKRYQLILVGLHPGVSWFIRAKGISNQFIMLSPLYNQGHRPPGPVRPYYPFPGDPAFPPFFPAGPPVS